MPGVTDRFMSTLGSLVRVGLQEPRQQADGSARKRRRLDPPAPDAPAHHQLSQPSPGSLPSHLDSTYHPMTASVSGSLLPQLLNLASRLSPSQNVSLDSQQLHTLTVLIAGFAAAPGEQLLQSLSATVAAWVRLCQQIAAGAAAAREHASEPGRSVQLLDSYAAACVSYSSQYCQSTDSPNPRQYYLKACALWGGLLLESSQLGPMLNSTFEAQQLRSPESVSQKLAALRAAVIAANVGTDAGRPDADAFRELLRRATTDPLRHVRAAAAAAVPAAMAGLSKISSAGLSQVCKGLLTDQATHRLWGTMAGKAMVLNDSMARHILTHQTAVLQAHSRSRADLVKEGLALLQTLLPDPDPAVRQAVAAALQDLLYFDALCSEDLLGVRRACSRMDQAACQAAPDSGSSWSLHDWGGQDLPNLISTRVDFTALQPFVDALLFQETSTDVQVRAL